jgi:hypothetical protein
MPNPAPDSVLNGAIVAITALTLRQHATPVATLNARGVPGGRRRHKPGCSEQLIAYIL